MSNRLRFVPGNGHLLRISVLVSAHITCRCVIERGESPSPRSSMVSYLVGITLVKMKLSQYSGRSTRIKIEQNLRSRTVNWWSQQDISLICIWFEFDSFIFCDCSQKSLELKSMLLGVSPAKLESNGAIEQIVVFLGTVVSQLVELMCIYIWLSETSLVSSSS